MPAMPLHGVFLAGVIFLCFFSIALMQTSLGLAGIAWLGDLSRKGACGRRFPLWKPIVAFALASLVSAICADDRARAFASLPETLLPAIVFLSAQLFDDGKNGDRALDVLLAAGIVAALVGLGQSLVQGSAYRIHGTLGHYMTYAGVMTIASLAAWARLLFAVERRARILSLVALATTLAALLMTHTRSAWLGWLAGAALALALRRRAALLLLPVLALLAFAIAPGAVRERIESLFDRRDVTAVERTYMWRSGLALWLDHFWLGVGPDNLREAYPAYKLPDDPWLPERRFSHLHNNPLQIAAERGALGLAAWLWIWCAWGVAAWTAWRAIEPSDVLARGRIAAGVAAIAGFHVIGLFEYDFGNSEVVTLAWIVAALPLAVRRHDTGGRKDARREEPARAIVSPPSC